MCPDVLSLVLAPSRHVLCSVINSETFIRGYSSTYETWCQKKTSSEYTAHCNMASFRFPPPESFNFERPSEWPEWKERFTRYRLASKLHKDTDDVQISALIYSMGRQGEHIFKSLVFAEEGDEGKYDKVLEKFDSYFVPKRNIIHERARFHL